MRSGRFLHFGISDTVTGRRPDGQLPRERAHTKNINREDNIIAMMKGVEVLLLCSLAYGFNLHVDVPVAVITNNVTDSWFSYDMAVHKYGTRTW